MKKLLLTLAALPAATFALEASAQTGASAGINVQNRIANLETRLEAGVQAGVIDRREARDLRRQMRDLRQLEMTYSQDGLTRQERAMLQQRIRTVRDQLRMAGGNGWGNRYGWSDSDFDAYGNSYGTSGTYQSDRYGRPVTNGYYGQGGPYEAAPSTGSTVGGLLGSILGNGGLRVGDVISGTLGNVLGGASTFGYQDRSNVYFRSDGQRVYEIDARTNRVIRVHPVR